VKELSPFYPITDLCAALGLSRSAYYAWLKRPPGPRKRQNQHLQLLIKSVFKQFKGTYGSPRIAGELKHRGHRCNRKRVERLMRQEGLVARRKRAFRVCTTDSNHDHPVSPNQLANRPPPTAINQVWVTDITYLPTAEGFLYIAAVMDLYSRRIVGWAMQESLDTSLTSNALQMALTHRQPPPGLLHHSDRGCQYASAAYRAQLHRAGLQSSMSRKGNCYDNAVIESFWSTLKNELLLDQHFQFKEQARQGVFQSIEMYYNRVRLHSSLGYNSPVDFERQLN
jgi:transposase InsO family protein